MTETETRRFEVETCGRCGGSGEYSYNAIDGTVCYGCRGKRKRYTKRGQAAFDYYRSLCVKKASEVVIGDCIETGGRVEKVCGIDTEGGMVVVKPGDKPRIEFETVNGYGLNTEADADVMTWPNGDEKRAKLAAAYDYQDTLTATGKPRKAKAVAG
jgi:hypothetical protein